MRVSPLCLLLGLALSSHAQTPTKPKSKPAANAQLVKPPVAQAWLDLATHRTDMPGMAGAMGQMMGGGGMPSLGQLFGQGESKGRGNSFGNTQGMGFSSSGQWLDVSVFTRANRGLSAAVQTPPAGSRLAPQMQLLAPQTERGVEPPAEREEDDVREPNFERPKGKLLLYWGCGEQVRAGQPRVLDFANMNLADVQRIMVARGSTPRGARSQAGMPAWPNKQDDRLVPTGARLAGENAFSGEGIPEGFRFQLRPDVDFMPAISLQNQAHPSGATQLNWQRIQPARAYFISAMGAKPGDDEGTEMVMWSSSELADTGFALHDYQTPAGIERLLKDKVLLAPESTRCAIPAGIFGAPGEQAGGMLRMTAYGPEQVVVHPPRPTDPKIAWEPEWQAKVRTKSTLMSMLGMAGAAGPARDGQMPPDDEEPAPKAEEKKPKMKDLLKGLLGF